MHYACGKVVESCDCWLKGRDNAWNMMNMYTKID